MIEIADKILSWVKTKPDVKIYEYQDDVISVEQAMKASGRPKSDLIKSIAMKNKDTNEMVVAIITAGSKVDKRLLKEEFGPKRWRMARPEEIAEELGFPVGGVPPVCLPSTIDVYVDPRVMRRDFVVGGGGTTSRLVGLPPGYIIEQGAIEKIVSKG